jgi:hypothetical protein
MESHNGTPLILSDTISRARQEIQRIARQYCQQAEVFSFGATDIDPRHLAIWIATQTDEERDQMRATSDLIPTFQRVLIAAGYPSAAVPEVAFEFESQETVDRDYEGNWWYAVK